MTSSRHSDMELFRRLLREAAPLWKSIVLVALLGILSSPLALLAPVPMKIAVDSALDDKPLPEFLAFLLPDSSGAILAVAAGMYVIIALLTKSQELVFNVASTLTGEKMLRGLRSRMFAHAQRLSLAYHDTKGTFDSVYRIQYDAMAVRQIVLGGLVPLSVSLLTVVAMLVVSMKIDWQLALISLGVCPLLLLGFVAYRKRIRDASRDVKRLESAAFGTLQESLGAVRVVKAFGQEDRERERFVERSNQGLAAHVRTSAMESAFSLVVGLAAAGGMAAVLYVGVRHVQAGIITLGELLVLMSYLAQLYVPLKALSANFGTVQKSLAGAERIYALLDERPDVRESPRARPLVRCRGHIEFQDVHFGYAPEEPVLRDVNFSVEPHSTVGISGRTGSGKTTLISLLTRFYDPDGGRILLDGQDIREFRVRDYRNQFSIVLQDAVLFSTTIAENIAYARPDASEAEIRAAAEKAHALDFIEQLPEGMATPVGERGLRLSGGERQRIALARAFLKDAPILILDEPTSAVDFATEEVIMDALRRLTSGRTCFTIAHRLSTLENCDVRLEVSGGTVAAAAPEAAPPLVTA